MNTEKHGLLTAQSRRRTIMIKCDPRAKAKCPFKEQCCGYDVGYFLEGSD